MLSRVLASVVDLGVGGIIVKVPANSPFSSYTKRVSTASPMSKEYIWLLATNHLVNSAGANINVVKRIFLRKLEFYLSPCMGLNLIFDKQGVLGRILAGCWNHHYIKQAKQLKKMLVDETPEMINIQ